MAERRRFQNEVIIHRSGKIVFGGHATIRLKDTMKEFNKVSSFQKKPVKINSFYTNYNPAEKVMGGKIPHTALTINVRHPGRITGGTLRSQGALQNVLAERTWGVFPKGDGGCCGLDLPRWRAHHPCSHVLRGHVLLCAGKSAMTMTLHSRPGQLCSAPVPVPSAEQVPGKRRLGSSAKTEMTACPSCSRGSARIHD